MNCPPEIAEIIIELLQASLLRIRILGGSGDSKRCAVEANHVHNLPDLLRNYTPGRLHYYWTVERPEFMRDIGALDREYQVLWNRLAAYADDIPGSAR